MSGSRVSIQPPPARPEGFGLIAGVAWTFAAVMAYALFVADASAGDGPFAMVAPRAFAALLAALAFVAGEAIWNVRPWAWRASVALAATYAAVAALQVFSSAHGVVDALGTFAGIAVLSASVVAPMLLYVHDRHVALFGPASRAVGGGRP